ncbi:MULTISPECIES: PAS domain S-box protein [unclassified Pseudoxanthomonas]|uniref:PAS domain-containing hybrid sensor histidine kinase/response regulator n=1 Tax=unclassified Pseudoxanthomonas TaxID=2645906 RepID=UPI0030787CB4
MGKHQGEAASGATAGPKRYALLVLLVGLGIAVLAGLQLDRSNGEERQARFQALSHRVAGELKTRISIYETGLRGARGAVIAAGGESVTRERFREYSQSRDYKREFPGVRGYGYIHHVLRAEENAFLEMARLDGTPAFAIQHIAPHDNDRFVIRYIEPESSNREAIGLDIASEANRRSAAIQAARSGMPTLTEPITLVQNASKPLHGFLLLLPIYRAGAATDTPEQRWQSTFGWSFAPISIDEVLHDFDLAESDYSLALWDRDTPPPKAPFYFTRDYQQPPASGLTDRQPITAYGQQWQLGIKARPSFVAGLNQTSPGAVGGAIAAIALLVSALVYFFLLNRQRRYQVSLDQARMAALVESSSDAILAEDTHGVITHWNRAAERMFGYSPSDAIGQPLRELIAPPAEQADHHDLLGEILSGQTVASFTSQRRHRSGHLIDVLVSASPIPGRNRSIVGVSHILHDITDRLRAEERFRLVVEASPSAMLMIDQDGVMALANRKAEELFGWPRRELVGCHISKLLPPSVHGHHGDYIRRYFQQPETRPMGAGRDLFGLRHDGTLVPVEIGLNPIETSDGRYALASIIDISERKRAEAHVMELNATLEQQVAERTAQIQTYSLLQRAILAHAGYAIIATDNHGTITLFNPAAEAMLGYRADEVIGHRTVAAIHDPGELTARTHPFPEVVDARSEKGDTDEWIFVRKDGSRLPVLLTLSTLRGEDGEVIGHLRVAVDLTERKSREQQLHQAMSAAESANRYKSDFLANMSHEIRTPMNAILGMVYLLEKSELPPAAQDMARKINSSARSLLAIINDVLDFSKIEAGRIELENEPFDLGEVLENMATLMSSAVGTKPVEMVVSPPPPGARCLKGDALRLGQVLINLVGNAIKFTERGEVMLAVRRLKTSEVGKVSLEFSVRDTGIGIPKEKQDLIFSAFNQVDTSTTRNFGGSGLGLTISRRLVNLMGGELRVDSEPGRGSEFSFVISVEPDESFGPDNDRELPHQVLVADDHDLARDNLVAIIQSFGWSVQAVDSGEAAIAAAAHDTNEHSDAADRYDIILLDWQMPQVDGLAAAEAIRKQAGTQRQPIIIMVTAHERKLLEQNLKGDVIDAVLTKPATASSLFNVIMDSLAKRGRHAAPRKRGPRHAQRLSGMHLLVVDDSDINREVAQRILESEGALVELASDGRDALDCIASGPGRFQVILMDVQMPEMDGYEATRRIRQIPAMAHLPVVALTAGAFKRQQEAALAAGMNAFVAKPFEVDELVDVIVRLSPPRPHHASPLELTIENADDVPAVADEEGPDPQLLDVQRGLAYWREEAPYRKYLAQFGRNYPHAAQEIGDHLHRGERDAAASYVHKMRGAAGSLALPTVASITAELETALHGSGDVSDLLEALQLALRETLADIASYAGAATVPDAASPAEDKPFAAENAPQLRQYLRTLLQSLDSDDPTQIEPRLTPLNGLVPPERLRRLQKCIDEFDFRSAETVVKDWLAALPGEAIVDPEAAT